MPPDLLPLVPNGLRVDPLVRSGMAAEIQVPHWLSTAADCRDDGAAAPMTICTDTASPYRLGGANLLAQALNNKTAKESFV